MYELLKGVVDILLWILIATSLIRGIKNNDRFKWIKDKWGDKGVRNASVIVVVVSVLGAASILI